MKKQLLWVLAGTGSFLVSLAVLAPLPVLAQQAIRLLPNLQLAGVSGTLWDGKIQRVTTPQVQVDDLSWTFAPQGLLGGLLAADVQAQVQTVQVKGQCGVSITTQLQCQPLQLDLEAANIQRLTPAAQNLPVILGGTIHAKLDDLSWDRVGIPAVNGDITWDQGSLQQPMQINLGGKYLARVRQSDKAGEALNIALQSDGSMIVLDGKINVETSGRYQAEIFLKPSAEADPSIGQGLSLLGAPQTDGSIRLKQEGQVVMPGAVAAN